MLDLAHATRDDLAAVFGPGAGYYAAGTAHPVTWDDVPDEAERRKLARFGVTPETHAAPPPVLASDVEFSLFDVGPLAARWHQARHQPLDAPTLAAALSAHNATTGDVWSLGDLLAGGLFVAWPPALDGGRWPWSDLYLVPPPVPVDRARWPLVVPEGAAFPLATHRDARLIVKLLEVSYDLAKEQGISWPADVYVPPLTLDEMQARSIRLMLEMSEKVARTAARALRNRGLPSDLPPLCPPIPWDHLWPDLHNMLQMARNQIPNAVADFDAAFAASVPEALAAGGAFYVAPGFAELALQGWWARA